VRAITSNGHLIGQNRVAPDMAACAPVWRCPVSCGRPLAALKYRRQQPDAVSRNTACSTRQRQLRQTSFGRAAFGRLLHLKTRDHKERTQKSPPVVRSRRAVAFSVAVRSTNPNETMMDKDG